MSISSRLSRTTCDCGRIIERKPNGYPKHATGGGAICCRCFDAMKEWKSSARNPDNFSTEAEKSKRVGCNGRVCCERSHQALPWTAWGTAAI